MKVLSHHIHLADSYSSLKVWLKYHLLQEALPGTSRKYFLLCSPNWPYFVAIKLSNCCGYLFHYLPLTSVPLKHRDCITIACGSITGFKIQISNKTVSASQRKSGKSAFSQWLSPNAVYSDGIYCFLFVWGTTWHIVKYPNLSGRELGGSFTYIPLWPAPSGEDFKHFHYPGCSFMLLPSQYSPPQG